MYWEVISQEYAAFSEREHNECWSHLYNNNKQLNKYEYLCAQCEHLKAVKKPPFLMKCFNTPNFWRRQFSLNEFSQSLDDFLDEKASTK